MILLLVRNVGCKPIILTYCVEIFFMATIQIANPQSNLSLCWNAHIRGKPGGSESLLVKEDTRTHIIKKSLLLELCTKQPRTTGVASSWSGPRILGVAPFFLILDLSWLLETKIFFFLFLAFKIL